jgi:hypothetical protein
VATTRDPALTLSTAVDGSYGIATDATSVNSTDFIAGSVKKVAK